MKTAYTDRNCDADCLSISIEPGPTPLFVPANARRDGNLTEGSTWVTIARMAWPITVNMLSLAAMSFFEGWIASRLGPDAQAAMGVGGQMWLLFMMSTLAMAAGTTAVISRYCGAGDLRAAVSAGRQALLCAALLSSVATAAGIGTCRIILHALGASHAVEEKGFAYLSTSLVSMIPYTILWISNSIFRASGDARTPMATMMLVFACIAGGDIVFCLSPLGMGIKGIGISWLLSSFIGIAVNFSKLKQSSLADIVDIKHAFREGLSISWAARFLRIGVPACIQDLALIGGSLGLFMVLSRLPHPLVPQAAWAAGWRLEETMTLMPMYGLNLAAAAIVGQNLGAGQPDRAAVCGWQVMALGVFVNIFVALSMLLWAPHIASLLCADPEVASTCAQYLQIVCWTEPFFACWRILSGAMEGAGYTLVPMAATVIAFAILRISLAALALGIFGGAYGIWMSMAVSTVVAGTLMCYFWNLGKWKHQQI